MPILTDQLATITWNIDPVLFGIGPLEIRYYGILFALSLFLAYLLARSMASKQKLNLENLDSLFIYLVIGLVLGARFGHIIFYELDFYLANPLQIFKIWEGGLASHGGAIGAMLAYGIFLWSHKNVKTFTYLDIMAVAATMPITFVRLGNFFNSEIVGRVTDLPWAVQFQRVDELSRHPSQIYEFLIGILVFAILYPLWLKKQKTAKPGFFFALLLTLYFSLRFLVEFVKEYPLHESFFNLTTGQILSLPFVAIGLTLLWKLPRR